MDNCALPPQEELSCIGCQEVSLGPAAFVAHAAKCLAVALIAKMQQQQQQQQHQQLVPDQQPPLPDDGVEIVAPPPVPDDEVSDWLSVVLVVPSSHGTVSRDPLLYFTLFSVNSWCNNMGRCLLLVTPRAPMVGGSLESWQ